MNQPNEFSVKLTLVDGTKREFTFEPPPNQDLRIAARVKDFINQQLVAFQLEDRLLMIPMTQIASIEFSPVVDKTIDGIFSHAKEILK